MTTNDDNVGATRLGGATTTRETAAATAVPTRAGQGGYTPAHRVDHDDTDINLTVPPQRGDQVRWGPVWAGLIVALPTFLLGTLILVAVGVLDTGDNLSGTAAGVWTGIIALGAFFLGSLTAAATTMWRGIETGLLHGIIVWALSIVAILALTILGAGSLLGSAGNIASQLIDPAAVSGAVAGADASDVPEVSEADAAAAAEAGQSAASYAVLGLGLTFAASALGGIVGAKFWPRKKDLDTTTSRHSGN